MAAKNKVSNIVEFNLNSCYGKNTDEGGYFFFFCCQAKRIKLFFNKMFFFNRRIGYRVFHDLYERQRCGLHLSPILRSFEGNAVFGGVSNSGDLLVDGGSKQEQRDKPKNKCHSGPNKIIHMANVM